MSSSALTLDHSPVPQHPPAAALLAVTRLTLRGAQLHLIHL